MKLQGITEDDIANYLVHTPSFFERHADLLAAVQLANPHGQRAVSLQERQMEMLREKIKGLERRIIDMVRHSQENGAAIEGLHRCLRAALLTHDTTQLPNILCKQLQHEFLIPQIGLRLWGSSHHPLSQAAQTLDCAQAVSDDIRSFARSLTLPYCGVNTGFDAAQWLNTPSSTASLAMLPLLHNGQVWGLMVLGSPDPKRYSSDMGVEFLSQLADMVSACLSPLFITKAADNQSSFTSMAQTE